MKVALSRMPSGEFVGRPPAASTQHQSAIRQQIRGQQAPQQAPRAAHSKLSKSLRSEVAFELGQIQFPPAAANGLSTGPQPSKARRTSRRTARRGRFREPGRCAGCGERGWRAGQLEGQTLARKQGRSSAFAAGRGHVTPATRGYQPSAKALALALAARQVGLRDWLRQCHGHRQR